MGPIVSTTQAVQSEETESEKFHPTIEQPLHETAELSKDVEEAHVPHLEPGMDKAPGVYSAWDASRCVLPAQSVIWTMLT